MMGANHIVQRLYMRNVPKGSLGAFGTPLTAAADVIQQAMQGLGITPGQSSSAQNRRAQGSLRAGDPKRPRVEFNQEWKDRAEIFDMADNMYAMEYMKNGDVCLSLSKILECVAHKPMSVLTDDIPDLHPDQKSG